MASWYAQIRSAFGDLINACVCAASRPSLCARMSESYSNFGSCHFQDERLTPLVNKRIARVSDMPVHFDTHTATFLVAFTADSFFGRKKRTERWTNRAPSLETRSRTASPLFDLYLVSHRNFARERERDSERDVTRTRQTNSKQIKNAGWAFGYDIGASLPLKGSRIYIGRPNKKRKPDNAHQRRGQK